MALRISASVFLVCLIVLATLGYRKTEPKTKQTLLEAAAISFVLICAYKLVALICGFEPLPSGWEYPPYMGVMLIVYFILLTRKNLMR